MTAKTAKTETPLDEFLRVARTFSDEHYINSIIAELRRCYSENAALSSRDDGFVRVEARWLKQLFRDATLVRYHTLVRFGEIPSAQAPILADIDANMAMAMLAAAEKAAPE